MDIFLDVTHLRQKIDFSLILCYNNTIKEEKHPRPRQKRINVRISTKKSHKRTNVRILRPIFEDKKLFNNYLKGLNFYARAAKAGFDMCELVSNDVVIF